jgi:hypothetical protein
VDEDAGAWNVLSQRSSELLAFGKAAGGRASFFWLRPFSLRGSLLTKGSERS